MSRRSGIVHTRDIAPDPVYKDRDVGSFINFIMLSGKKSTAQTIFYKAMNIIKEKTKEEGIEIFRKALEQTKPLQEVRSRRVGGVTYQVPREVRPERMLTLAFRWLTLYSRTRKEKGMAARLAAELIDASKGQGGAAKKRSDVRRMAESNKAFSHYRW